MPHPSIAPFSANLSINAGKRAAEDATKALHEGTLIYNGRRPHHLALSSAGEVTGDGTRRAEAVTKD